MNYDKELSTLRKEVAQIVIELATGRSTTPSIRRALLQRMPRLCAFFGRSETHDYLLPLVITFLNDRDWQLRADFFKQLPRVCQFVGPEGFEAFMLPCVELSLTHADEEVIAETIRFLVSLCTTNAQLDGFRTSGNANTDTYCN